MLSKFHFRLLRYIDACRPPYVADEKDRFSKGDAASRKTWPSICMMIDDVSCEESDYGDCSAHPYDACKAWKRAGWRRHLVVNGITFRHAGARPLAFSERRCMGITNQSGLTNRSHLVGQDCRDTSVWDEVHFFSEERLEPRCIVHRT